MVEAMDITVTFNSPAVELRTGCHNSNPNTNHNRNFSQSKVGFSLQTHHVCQLRKISIHELTDDVWNEE